MYILRELQRSDIPTINLWRNNRDLISWLGAPFRYINAETEEKWFADYMVNRNNCVRCVIAFANKQTEAIGLVSLTDINWIHRSCTLHIMVGNEESRGKGAGTFAVNSILEHAFLNLNLNRVELSVLSHNKIAMKLYKKSGFVEEGIKRSASFKNGEYNDLVMMSILESEWRAEKSS